MTTLILRALWSHTLPGQLDSEDIEAIEGIASLRLRAAHRPHEATIGHRFLQSSDRGDTVIRVRRDADSGGVVLDLVSSDHAQTVEDWQREIEVLEEAVHTVERLRQMRDVPARPRAFIAMPMTTPPTSHVGHTKLARMLKALHAAGIDTDLPDSGHDALFATGSLSHSTSIEPLAAGRDRARLADVDLVLVLGWGSDSLTRYGSGLWIPALLSVGNASSDPDVVVPFDAHLQDVGNPQELGAWLDAELPGLTRRARTRRSLFYRLLRQLPRARARLTTLDDAVVERSGLSRDAALMLLRSPAAYASATVSETYALHLALGTDFVPHLQFRPPVQIAAKPGVVPDYEWVATVAGPFLTERETDSLAAAAEGVRATAEQLTRAVETYLDTLTDVHAGRRGLNSPDDWTALLVALRSNWSQ